MAFKLESSEGGGGAYRIGPTLSEINIIPLVEVVAVLLLILLLTPPLMPRGIDVNLPKSTGRPTATEERLVLTLTKDQTVFLNDKPVPMSGLDGRLRESMKDRSDKTLYLKADKGPDPPGRRGKARDGHRADEGTLSALGAESYSAPGRRSHAWSSRRPSLA